MHKHRSPNHRPLRVVAKARGTDRVLLLAGCAGLLLLSLLLIGGLAGA